MSSESPRYQHLAQDINYVLSALSFLLSSGAVDNAGAWASLSDGERDSIKSQYNDAGIKLIVSAFGSTETPTSSGVDPVGAATTMGNWVRQYNLDGIDVDYEVTTSYMVPNWSLADDWSGFQCDEWRHVDRLTTLTIESLTLRAGSAEEWLITYTQTLRNILPQGGEWRWCLPFQPF